jgi:glycosyltransferase involved in cell wall biosynthesis
MRILVLTPTFLPAVGGAELVILQIYRRLSAKHDVRILTPYLSKEILMNSSPNVYDHLVNFEVQRYFDKTSFMKIRGHRVTLGLIPPFSISAVFAIKHALKDFEPDVINVHYVMPTGLAGVYAQKFGKIPTVITYNGRDVPGPGVPSLWKYWHQFIGRNCQNMTFVSKYCRDVIYGCNSNKGHIIYNGVEYPSKVSQSQKNVLRSKLNLNGNERILFSLQRLDHIKRVDVLIKSMDLILKRLPNTSMIIGGKGPDMPRLKKIAKKLGLAEKIIFTGFIPEHEIPIYFGLADLFVFNSTYETFGMVLAEAMNYGKAVVSVKNTAICEVVDQGKTGLLVQSNDYEAFAKAASELLNDERRRKKMGRKGKEKVDKLFLWDKVALQYENVLASAASS